MAYPQEYIDFLVHFHGNRDYFECHEILEEYWKTTETKKKDSIWVGFILLAVSQYHHRRGNFSGAYKTLQKSLHILRTQPDIITELGMSPSLLVEQLQALLAKIMQKEGYESINLPLTSPTLLGLCQKRSRELNMKWGSKSNLYDADLIHRHMRRDRSLVIQERNEALKKRQTKETGSNNKE